MSRYGMVIDLRRCTGCYACQVSCKMENAVTISQFRCRLKTVFKDKYPSPKMFSMTLTCNQCENPVCIADCPTDATYKLENGITVVDYEKCISCGNCVALCPYGARYIDEGNKERLNKADKCDFCLHRVEVGLEPACVRNCFGKAMNFGDLNDEKSTVRRLLRENKTRVLKPEFNTEPKIYYIS